jgi:hypothetical protein
LVNLQFLYHYSYLFLKFSKWFFDYIFRSYLITKGYSINLKFFPWPWESKPLVICITNIYTWYKHTKSRSKLGMIYTFNKTISP